MIEMFYGIGIAILIAVPIAFMSYRRHRVFHDYSDVFVKNGHADFYKGKPGKKPTRNECLKIYKRDDWQCQFPGCGVGVFEGNANNKRDHLLGLVAGSKPGNIHHITPDDIGGNNDEKNLKTLCQPHNLLISNHVTPWTIEYCRENGKTINPKGLKIVTRWSQYKIKKGK